MYGNSRHFPLLARWSSRDAIIQNTSTLVVCALVPCIAIALSGCLSRKKNHFPLENKTAVITGGSQGLGLCVGKQLAAKGANVVIVAQDTAKLDAALAQIKNVAKSPTQQRFLSLSYDLRSPTSAPEILARVTRWNNDVPPSIVWCCAGHCIPGFFADTSIGTLRGQMETVYWSAAYMAHAALRQWLSSPPYSTAASPSTAKDDPPRKEGKQLREPPSAPSQSRHIIFTSSTLAFFPVAGYAPYTSAKAAMKALSDTLVQEVAMHNAQYNRDNTNQQSTTTDSFPQTNMKIHALFPMGILTPGYDHENKLKPALTLQLEEADRPQDPAEVARIAVDRLEQGDYLITTTFLGHVMRGAGMGASLRNGADGIGSVGGLVLDLFWSLIGLVAALVVVPDLVRKSARWGRENSGGRREKG